LGWVTRNGPMDDSGFAAANRAVTLKRVTNERVL